MMRSTAVSEGPAMDGRGRLLEAIRGAQKATGLCLIRAAADRGLGSQQFWPLYYLVHGGETHPGLLARRLGITAPACTVAVDHLVNAGLVVRRPSKDDRRQIVLVATPKGRRLVVAVWKPFEEEFRRATADLSPDALDVTSEILTTVADRLRATNAAAAAGGRR